jgi:FkbM family methyltransferase
MAKIFIDVGGFRGESIRAALDPRFAFDSIHSFEPVASCYDEIVRSVRNPRVTVHKAGLLDRSDDLPVYGAGTLGASVYAGPDPAQPGERCAFIRASDFFARHIAEGDRVWMKLNCEGSECDILIDLLRSGEAGKLSEVLIDLDARKIPAAAPKVEILERMLVEAPFSYHFPEEVQYGMVNNYGGIRNWLVRSGAIAPGPARLVRSLAFQLRDALDPAINGYYKIRLLRLLRLRPPAPLANRDNSIRKSSI